MNANNLINLAEQPGFAEMAIDFLMKTNKRLTQELKASVEDHDGDYKILTSYRDVMGEIEELEEQDYFEGSTIDGLVDYIKKIKKQNKTIVECQSLDALTLKVSELEEKLLSANVEVALWENTLANYGDTPAEVNESIGELECEKDNLEERKDELASEVSDWEDKLSEYGCTPDEVYRCVEADLIRAKKQATPTDVLSLDFGNCYENELQHYCEEHDLEVDEVQEIETSDLECSDYKSLRKLQDQFGSMIEQLKQAGKPVDLLQPKPTH